MILPRFLPYSADSHVASLVMGRDRVSAGMALIEAADPKKARNIEWSSQFYENNAGGIGSCFEAGAETGKNQTCTITVGPPVK
nr:DUF6118 family protein [Aureimonas sp. Leaf460]